MSKIGFHPHLKMNTLPFVDLPNSDYPSFFYKTKYRINPDRMVTLLGLKLHVMSRYQQDHILFLIQLFNKQCPRIKIRLFTPNFLYTQVRIDLYEEEQTEEGIELEGRLFRLMEESIKFWQNFVKQNINPIHFQSIEFKEDHFENNFRKLVIDKVKGIEKYLFNQIQK